MTHGAIDSMKVRHYEDKNWYPGRDRTSCVWKLTSRWLQTTGSLNLSVGLVLARLCAKDYPIRHQDYRIRQWTMHGHPSTSRRRGEMARRELGLPPRCGSLAKRTSSAMTHVEQGHGFPENGWAPRSMLWHGQMMMGQPGAGMKWYPQFVCSVLLGAVAYPAARVFKTFSKDTPRLATYLLKPRLCQIFL